MAVQSTLHTIVVIAALLGFTAASAAATEVTFEKNKIYGRIDDREGRSVELKYDIARPSQGQGPFPLVICVHAGGWELGDKKSYHDVIVELAKRGYVAATVNYRLAPDYPWPAQAQDVQDAVRYFRQNAAKLHIDPKRIGFLGDDSGAHIALMVGLMAAKEEKDIPLEESTRVQAVANFFAPTDLRKWQVSTGWVEAKIRVAFLRSSEQIMEDLLGTRDRTAPIYEEVSPVTNVTPDAPPIFTVVGTEDPLVSLEQSQEFHETLKQAGVDQELLLIPGADHSRDGVNANNNEADAKAFEFLDKYLKPVSH